MLVPCPSQRVHRSCSPIPLSLQCSILDGPAGGSDVPGQHTALVRSTRGWDVTEASPKESRPRLTDVLYLLTDSQELLLSKVQSMRMGYANASGGMTSVDEHSLTALDASSGAHMRTSGSCGTQRDEEGASQSSASSSPVSSSPVSSPAASSSDVMTDVPVMTASPEVSELGLHAPTAAVGETASKTNAHESVSEVAGTRPSAHNGSVDRSYNFFDDLDQRLADLGGPDQAS